MKFFFLYSYESPLVNDGLRNQQSNPEVSVDPKSHATFLSDQIMALRAVKTQLRNAFNGYDVEWIDNEEAFDAGSGSGMGPDTDNTGIGSSFEGSGDSRTPVIFDVTSESSSVIPNVDVSTPNTSNVDVFPPISITPSIDVRKLSEPGVSYESSTTADYGTVSVRTTTVSSVNNTSGGTSIRYQKISLNKAIASYLLPTVVIWMGCSFNDWFNSLV